MESEKTEGKSASSNKRHTRLGDRWEVLTPMVNTKFNSFTTFNDSYKAARDPFGVSLCANLISLVLHNVTQSTFSVDQQL